MTFIFTLVKQKILPEMYKRQILFCCLAQLTIVMSATTSSIDILADTTPKSTVARQCLYNGQLYNEGDIYNSIDDCNTCSCGWYGTTCTLLFCPNTHATTTPSSNISPDLTSTSATSTTSSTISPDTSSTTTAGQCIYNGQVYNDGDNFIANNYCQSYCWCMGSHLICTMCPPQTSTSTTSSTISPDTSSTTTSTTSSTISPDTSTTPASTTSSTISPDTSTTSTAGQCVYNGQVYNDGDMFTTNDYCQHYCWCTGSHMICTMCPTQTSTLTTSSTISPDTTMTTTPTRSTTISPDISRSTTSTSFSSRIPTMTSTSTYKKKRRRTTLPPALYTKTMKFHTDVFDTITKKPHFTTHNSRQFGSKRTAIPKGNRKNVDIR